MTMSHFFSVDDLTGIIHCIKFFNTFKKFEVDSLIDELPSTTELGIASRELLLSIKDENLSLKLGCLVEVRGRLNLYGDHPQIICNYIRKFKFIILV